MMRKWVFASILTLGVGCSSYTYKLQSAPNVYADADWTKEFGKPLSLKVAGDTIYVAASQGVYAMKAGGAKVWATGQMPPAERFVAVGEGKVVITEYAIGEKRHNTDKSASNMNERENGHVKAFDLATGAQAWDVPFDTEHSKLSPPSVGQGKVVVTNGFEVIGIDAGSGQVQWTTKLVKEWKFSKVSPFARPAPAIVDGKVCAVGYTNAAIYDLATGAMGPSDHWSGYLAANPSAASGSGICYIATSMDGQGHGGKNQVLAIDVTQPKKFKDKWSTKVGSDPKDLGVATVELVGDRIYALTNFRIVAIDAKSGDKIWEVKDEPIYPSPSDSRVFTSHATSWSLNFAIGVIMNDRPGTRFAATADKVFVPMWFNPDDAAKKAGVKGHDVVTVLDAKTGGYMGSYDPQGPNILDIAIGPDGSLIVATADGIKTTKTDIFVPVVAKK